MCARKFETAGRVWSRRTFLGVGAGALLSWPMLSTPQSALAKRFAPLPDNPFSLGIASGEPTPDGFVLWTRLAPKPLEGGGMPHENLKVRWQVAHDEAMTKVAAEGTAVATPELAHSVHVEVGGLEPNRWYFYRFDVAGEASVVGRARTAPQVNDLPDRLRMAFASCQHFESGHYTAYEHMAKEDLDLIAHLGDYIYEGPGKTTAFRVHVGPLLRELTDYRNRHAQYKTDPHLQAAHAKCPWLVTWDDHEFANNCAGGISEKPDDDPTAYLFRRAAAYQAYYEHMPLRQTQIPHGPDMLLYRRVPWGRLAAFDVLDTRQYRTDQPCGDGNKPPCDAVYDPRATLMGDAQEQWLYRQLDRTTSTWNVLTQQVMMARVDRKAGEEIAYSMDQWPGYEANRQRMLKYFAAHPQINPIVIAGDIHCNWANNLQVDSSNPDSPIVGTEFVGTSISSGGNGAEQRKDTPELLKENPFVRFFNDERGYVSCEATRDRWTTHFRTVPFVDKPGAPLQTRKSFVVERNKPGVQET
jgi:alkaline phosphatase D